MHFGYQISSIRHHLTTTESVRESFRRLTAIGYRTVQLQWIDPEVPAKNVHLALYDTKLTSIGVQDLYAAVSDNFDYYRSLLGGWGYLTVSRIPKRFLSPEGLQAFAGELRALAGKIDDIYAKLTFHPVAEDLRPIGGRPAVEWLLDAVPDMQLTPCFYHVVRAGLDPIALLERWSGRVDLVHLKNAARQPDGSEALVPVGQGSIDWPPIFEACERAGVQYGFAEQETALKDPFVCAAESFAYLTKQGLDSEDGIRFTGTHPVVTPRLLLRRMTPRDADAIFTGWASDPLVSRFFTWKPHRDIGETKRQLASWIAEYDDPLYYHWIIVDMASGRPIGNIYLGEIDLSRDSCCLGCILARDRWGQGLAAEAMRGVIRYAFDEGGFSKVCARRHEDNAASGRALLKAGMRPVGVARRACADAPEIDGTYYLYEIERSDILTAHQIAAADCAKEKAKPQE